MRGVATDILPSVDSRGPIGSLAEGPEPSAVLFVIGDVVKDLQLVPAAGDRDDVATVPPQSALVALVAEAEMGVALCPADARQHSRVGKTSQQVKMDGVERQYEQLNLLIQQHVDQRPADHLAVGSIGRDLDAGDSLDLRVFVRNRRQRRGRSPASSGLQAATSVAAPAWSSADARMAGRSSGCASTARGRSVAAVVRRAVPQNCSR